MKLKTIQINATMGTDCYLDVNVPESATESRNWTLFVMATSTVAT